MILIIREIGVITSFWRRLIRSLFNWHLLHHFLDGTRSHRRRPDRPSVIISRKAEEAKAGESIQCAEAAALPPHQELEAEPGPAIQNNLFEIFADKLRYSDKSWHHNQDNRREGRSQVRHRLQLPQALPAEWLPASQQSQRPCSQTLEALAGTPAVSEEARLFARVGQPHSRPEVPADLLQYFNHDLAGHPQPLLQEARGTVPEDPEDSQVQVQHAAAHGGALQLRQVPPFADGSLWQGDYFRG